MALVTLQEILAGAAASLQPYAVGAFNVHNMEFVQGVIEAAEIENAPVILMVGEPMLHYFGMGWIAALCRYAAECTKLPVVIHLDHSRNFANIVKAIKCGFSSVMIDGSRLRLPENIALTRKVVEVARAARASVEGELGAIGGKEDDVETPAGCFTDPDEARQFVAETGVDALAVAIGNRHGLYKGEPRLDFERLAKIREAVDCPLVMHGGSDIPDDQVRRSVELGIRKFNVGTELKIAFKKGVAGALESKPESFEVPHLLGPARREVVEVARRKMRLLGCSGKVRG